MNVEPNFHEKMERVFILMLVTYILSNSTKAYYTCKDLSSESHHGYTKTTLTMMHIACAFCKQHKRSCETAICSQIKKFPYANFGNHEQDMKTLAAALCDLCKYHKLGCKNTFCKIDSKLIKEQKYITSTCTMCKVNGTSCKKARNSPNTIDWMTILDGPIWDRVLADDMFTSLLIGDVERGKWDGFLDNILPVRNDEYYDYYGEYLYDEYEDDFYEYRDSFDDD